MAANYGTVFEVAKGSNTITTIAQFNGTNGAYPGGLILDHSGNIYGTAARGANGYGTTFEIAKGSNTITTLALFTASTGYGGGLTLDVAGNLYGTTYQGTANKNGTVFEIAKVSNTLTTLASFNGANGEYPDSLTIDASGNLYGATGTGGAIGGGTVFEIPTGSATITVLATFNTTVDGPGRITLDGSGNLFGTTSGGAGTLFEIGHGSNAVTTLVSFDVSNGEAPNGLTPDGFGNFYGTTQDGGPGGYGTVFELTANTAVTLAQTGGANPADPEQSLSFTATVTGGVPDGETVNIVDTNNSNAVVATGTLSGGSATLTVPAGTLSAGTLSAGTHNLIAAYAGDANHAASQSAAYAQTVLASPPTLVGAPVINGDDPNGLYNAPGQPSAGMQRSMVEDVVYTFNEPVTIPNANGAFTVQVAGSLGTVPSTLLATVVPGSNGTQWAQPAWSTSADGIRRARKDSVR